MIEQCRGFANHRRKKLKEENRMSLFPSKLENLEANVRRLEKEREILISEMLKMTQKLENTIKEKKNKIKELEKIKKKLFQEESKIERLIQKLG
jgi:phage shock protein A